MRYWSENVPPTTADRKLLDTILTAANASGNFDVAIRLFNQLRLARSKSGESLATSNPFTSEKLETLGEWRQGGLYGIYLEEGEDCDSQGSSIIV